MRKVGCGCLVHGQNIRPLFLDDFVIFMSTNTNVVSEYYWTGSFRVQFSIVRKMLLVSCCFVTKFLHGVQILDV